MITQSLDDGVKQEIEYPILLYGRVFHGAQEAEIYCEVVIGDLALLLLGDGVVFLEELFMTGLWIFVYE